jgi:hypothetical protein
MRRAKQQTLPLGLDRRHENPGRPRGKNPRIAHASRDAFPADHPCHVTLRVRPGLPTLRDPQVVREIEAAFRRGNERKQFRLVHYSIQDDHTHLIVEASGAFALGRGMKSLASLFAFAVNRALGRTGRVLADRYHLRVLKCPRQVRNAIAYVLLNARKHAEQRIQRLRRSGLRNVPSLRNHEEIDYASSGRWFAGWQAARIRGAASLPAVALPRTWLLRVGWRMHGLIDPNAVPVHA